MRSSASSAPLHARADVARASQLSDDSFDAFFCSPLRRAAQTGARVWGARPGSPTLLPALREIDLYSLQGVVKAEVATAAAEDRERMSAQLAAWKAAPAAFELDGHAPVRELWHRASLAWQAVLGEKKGASKGTPKGQERATLLVAHNAVNQALLGTAVGWGPDTFRRFEQSNGALTVRHPCFDRLPAAALTQAHDRRCASSLARRALRREWWCSA